jgi:hypothetical protein
MGRPTEGCAMDIEWDHEALRAMRLEADESTRQVVDEVQAELSGQPFETVYGVLLDRLQTRAVTPDAADVRRYAEAISAGTLDT